jgi:hypothetical protein
MDDEQGFSDALFAHPPPPPVFVCAPVFWYFALLSLQVVPFKVSILPSTFCCMFGGGGREGRTPSKVGVVHRKDGFDVVKGG